jgi:hypothetical protein
MSNLRVSQSYAVAPATLWGIVGAPAGIAAWHPAMAQSPMDGDKRTITLADGAVINEQVIRHSDDDMAYTYRIVESPLPLRDYESTISVEIDPDGARLTWSAEFAPAGAPAADVEAMVRGLYEAGLQGVAGVLAQG